VMISAMAIWSSLVRKQRVMPTWSQGLFKFVKSLVVR
jgi:hypothetical protein